MPKPFGTNIRASIRSDNTAVPLIIYDGECDFCIGSVRWVQKRAQVEAISFHTAPLADYGLTKEQCAKEVIVLAEGQTYAGASAIACLLEVRGNRVASALVNAGGPISRFGYRWIANHRNSIVVKTATRYLKWRA